MKHLLILLCITCSVSLSAQEYSTALMAAKMDLDSAWIKAGQPIAGSVCLPQELKLKRTEGMSNHDCLEKAIKVAKTEGADAALPWIMTAFCYDQPAQDRIGKAGKEALYYIMDQWGGGRETIAGQPVPPPTVEPVVLKINFTNKTGDFVYLYSLMTDEADGRRDCKEYKFTGVLNPNRSHLEAIGKGRYMWIRISKIKDKGPCDEFKEYKVGPKPDQTFSTTEEIFIQ